MSDEKLHLSPAGELRRPPKRCAPLALLMPCLCLAFALVCALIANKLAPEPVVAAPTEPVAFVSLTPENAGTPVAVCIRQADGSFTLRATEDGYALEGEALAIDSGRARALLTSGASILGRSPMRGKREDFGLGEDALTAEYTYEDGRTLTLLLGDAPATGAGRYACLAEGGDIYVVNTSLYELLSASRYALAELPDLSEIFTAQTLMEVDIRRPGQEELAIRRITERNPFNSVAELVRPVHYPVNSERTGALFMTLAQLRPERLLTPSGEDGGYGLDMPLAEIYLTGEDNRSVALIIGSDDTNLTLRMNGEAAVYALPAGSADFLQQVTVAYLAEQLPGLVAVSEVNEVISRRGDEMHRLEIVRTDKAESYVLDGTELEETTFRALYQGMIGLLIDGYSKERPEEPEARASLEYHLTDGAVWTLAFAPKDENYDWVLRDGETGFLIARSKVDVIFDEITTLSNPSK